MTNNYIDQINIQTADIKKAPSTPIPAATVLLLKDTSDTFEVFMLKRAAASNFGNAWVFPGGKVDPEDINTKFSDKLNLDERITSSEDIGYFFAAIRECFEESGVLLAKRSSGELFFPTDQKEHDDLKKYQAQINNGEINFFDILIQLNLYPDINNLKFLSHWTTPLTEKKRYSTKFFLSRLPNNQQAVHDGFEGVESLWITSQKALNLYNNGKFPIILPTIKSLEELSKYASTSELLDNTSNSNLD